MSAIADFSNNLRLTTSTWLMTSEIGVIDNPNATYLFG